MDDGHPFLDSFLASGTSMLITDARRADHPIAFVNDAFTALTGYTRKEIVGRNCRFLQGPDTDPETVAAIREAIQSGEGIETEILNYRKDGSSFWNALVIGPVRDKAGDLLYFTASQLDVSDRKRTELELSRLRNVLNEHAQHRIQDLQAALDSKTALLRELDHRVKNSLQVISSLVLLKARRMQDERAQQALYGIAERISALSTVHRLLSTTGDGSHLDLRALVGDLSEDLMARLPTGQVLIETAIEPIVVAADDAVPLALLIDELVGNALLHAYPNGRHGRLSITVARDGSELCLVVEDDGVGQQHGVPTEEGFGKSLIDMSIRQLQARIAWEDAGPGTRVVVRKPLEGEEIQI